MKVPADSCFTASLLHLKTPLSVCLCYQDNSVMALGVPVNGVVCEGGGVTLGTLQTCSVLAESLVNYFKVEPIVSLLFLLLELQT